MELAYVSITLFLLYMKKTTTFIPDYLDYDVIVLSLLFYTYFPYFLLTKCVQVKFIFFFWTNLQSQDKRHNSTIPSISSNCPIPLTKFILTFYQLHTISACDTSTTGTYPTIVFFLAIFSFGYKVCLKQGTRIEYILQTLVL